MTKLKKLLIPVGIMAACACSSASALLLDFTVEDNAALLSGGRGDISGIGFTLTPASGSLKFNERYDGSQKTGCLSESGVLACDRDGVGIGNDEISAGQILSLVFDNEVMVSSLFFLDLYVSGNGREQAQITIDGAATVVAGATESSGQGGFVQEVVNLRATTIEFAAQQGSLIQDDSNNDFAFAGIEFRAVGIPDQPNSVVPGPGTAWLLATGLLGFLGITRRRRAV